MNLGHTLLYGNNGVAIGCYFDGGEDSDGERVGLVVDSTKTTIYGDFNMNSGIITGKDGILQLGVAPNNSTMGRIILGRSDDRNIRQHEIAYRCDSVAWIDFNIHTGTSTNNWTEKITILRLIGSGDRRIEMAVPFIAPSATIGSNAFQSEKQLTINSFHEDITKNNYSILLNALRTSGRKWSLDRNLC
ncbi:hypothetical protein GEMRC1_001056 [Eukaryota sp. GEM-RC1]